MIRIDTEKLEALGYQLIQDGDDAEHLCISGMPFDTPEAYSDVIKHANAIKSCSEVFPFTPQVKDA